MSSKVVILLDTLYGTYVAPENTALWRVMKWSRSIVTPHDVFIFINV